VTSIKSLRKSEEKSFMIAFTEKECYESLICSSLRLGPFFKILGHKPKDIISLLIDDNLFTPILFQKFNYHLSTIWFAVRRHFDFRT